MGMFDTISCKYPLPGNVPAFVKAAHSFQTKSMDCLMFHYDISRNGNLSCKDDVNAKKWTGSIIFYTSNISGSGPGLYTSTGEDAVSVEYKATFINGKIRDLVEIENKTEPAMPSKSRWHLTPPTKEEIKQHKEWQNRPLDGKKLYVQYGGGSPGYAVTVITTNKKGQIVVQKSNGEFEILNRRFLGSILFDSKKDSTVSDKKRKDAWAKEKAEWEAYKKSWEQAHKKKKVSKKK